MYVHIYSHTYVYIYIYIYIYIYRSCRSKAQWAIYQNLNKKWFENLLHGGLFNKDNGGGPIKQDGTQPDLLGLKRGHGGEEKKGGRGGMKIVWRSSGQECVFCESLLQFFF